ncbi:MAG TPA: hypothetical protein VHJ17_18090 [Thermomonospora sp.]|nr:hypothetical protein [Thermomonospora sp.]
MTARQAVRPGGTIETLKGAVAAEWTKAWSVRSTWWGAVAGVVLMAAASAQTAIYIVDANTNTDPSDDRGVTAWGQVAAQAVELAQFAVIALAMLLVTAEYAAGSMRTTVQWVPQRGALLAAKAVVAAVVCGVTGAVMAVTGALAAWPLLGSWGAVSATGLIGDVLTIAVYLAVMGAATVGAAMALRSAVTTLTVVFLLMTVVPASLSATDLTAAERIAELLPHAAGGAFLRDDGDPYSPAAGAALLAAWAAVALAAGLSVLRRRDA